MSSRRGNGGIGRFLAAGLALVSAGLQAGCFQPVYGTYSAADAGNAPSIRSSLASIQVDEVEVPNGTPEARQSVEIRNSLIFGLTGGGGQLPPRYKLKMSISSSAQNVIVDITTARTDMEIYGIDATYSLTEISTGKTVLTGRAFARASYDIPGQEQRFARQRGQRDAENRSSTIIAEQIKTRLASYFISGG
ncbi:MAG: LPS assembly lipoprotein LptE [Pseudorhodoplanes sp.]